MPIISGHWPYIVALLVIVTVIWGPRRLPEIGGGAGKAIREFRLGLHGPSNDKPATEVVREESSERPS